nr:transposase (putative), gypsy type [Tanacetum cinerariifolium]
MMLQLTDITSEITDEELLEFTSEYYILLALHPVVLAVNASIAEFRVGKLGVYTRFFEFANQQMDLFSGVHLSKPKLVTEGVRPLRDGEEPLLEATVGRTMELVLELPEDENTTVLEPTPLQRNVTCVDYSEAAGITRAESETEEVNSGLKRMRATSGDGAGSSKRVRHVILGDSASTEGEAMDASPTPSRAKFRQGVEERLEKQEGKVRKLSIEYDEELYPHLVSSIADHMAEAMEELHENKLLTVPAAHVPGYNKDAYEELVAAMEKMKLLELPHI